MKTYKSILIVAILIAVSVQSFAQLTFTNNRRLGINRTPDFTLDVEGTTRFSGWTDVILDWSDTYALPNLYPERDGHFVIGKNDRRVYLKAYQCWSIYYSNYSDERIKENIQRLDGSLEKIKLLNSYSYNLKDEHLKNLPKNELNYLNKRNIGYVAQEVEGIFPELVTRMDTSGVYGVNYVGFIPVITDAIKEQQNQISTLQTIVFSQEKEIIELKNELDQLSKKGTKLKSTTTNPDIIEQNETSLYQNNPNPFTIDTEIKYFLANNISDARLIIHDMQGLEIMSYLISERGNGSKIIKASELKAGMYLYTLIADGQIIDSKRMILTSE